MTSPVDGQACRPSRLNATQPGCSRSLMLATCLGGITLASGTWKRLLCASQTHRSPLSSGVRFQRAVRGEKVSRVTLAIVEVADEDCLIPQGTALPKHATVMSSI
jgi:hypothetical protein